jgi:pyruvate kinase
MLRKMTLAGMDFVRLNFSHGTRENHQAVAVAIRDVNRKYRRHVRIIADLEGPRIRLSSFPRHKPVELKKGRTVYIVKEAKGNPPAYRLPIDYPGSLLDFEGAHCLFLDDGILCLQVEDITENRIKTKAATEGIVRERKALNAPGAKLQFPSLTAKDKDDIEFCSRLGVDWIAQSFVRTPDDVREVRDLVYSQLPDCGIIAKIENRAGIRNIDRIIDASDGIMIARGDMAVSIPIYEVPFVQSEIIKKCNGKGKMVITATQMLEHMTSSPRPTRAEATDVTKAVLDGTDCVMLSGETAVGKFPVQTVKMMNDIVKYTEQRMEEQGGTA